MSAICSEGRIHPRPLRSFSFIRTVTVGSGIAPDLLTLSAHDQKALAGWGRGPYRRWGLSPRPENGHFVWHAARADKAAKSKKGSAVAEPFETCAAGLVARPPS